MNVPAAFLAVLFLVPAVRGCDPGGSTSPSGGTGSGSDPDPVVVHDPVHTDCPIDAADPVTVDYADIDGDLLTIGVSYSGGCEDHAFALCWDGAWIKTSPMKVGLTLQHDANGDACRVYLMEEHTFDLTAIADETIGGFPAESGVWVLLDDQSLWYAF